jgi:cytochrome c oxidase subunit 1
MNPTLGTGFMISTLLISVPSAIKVFNWLGTIWQGNLRFHVPMMHELAFVGMFVIGGLSGVFLATTPVDIYVHDTYFVVAHLHYVLFGGSLFALFGAITFWYPKMFGRLMNPTLGKIHFWLTFVFYNLVFFPMHQLGLHGHMRRIYDPTNYEYLRPLQPINTFISVCAFGLFASQIIFAVNFIGSWFWGAKASENPWEDNGLEWTLPSPPPHGNFVTVPTVHRGPYEYSFPQSDRDSLPQSEPLPARGLSPHPQPAGD